ncbi:MAG: hypothetical protein B7733_07505 [Myxococcales bacterium FL481]|nr:MAG: hypothetical protein B7733_07505 [Myxococcales bacterium FL481]
MTSKSISLPDPIWQLIHRKVESGEYRDESEYLAKLAQADHHRQELEAWGRFVDRMKRAKESPLEGPLEPGEARGIVEKAAERFAARNARTV